jgi:hypothetical protein
VAPEVIADERRRGGEEAVRRIRAESLRRIVLQGRAAGLSRCMLGTFVALLLFVALESRRAHWARIAVAAEPARSEAVQVAVPAAAGAEDKARLIRRHTCKGIRPSSKHQSRVPFREAAAR